MAGIFSSYHPLSPNQQASTHGPSLYAWFTPITRWLWMSDKFCFKRLTPPPIMKTVDPGHKAGISQKSLPIFCFNHSFITAGQGYCPGTKMASSKRHGMNCAQSTVKNMSVSTDIFLEAISLAFRGWWWIITTWRYNWVWHFNLPSLLNGYLPTGYQDCFTELIFGFVLFEDLNFFLFHNADQSIPVEFTEFFFDFSHFANDLFSLSLFHRLII